jgi:hypothetical protein
MADYLVDADSIRFHAPEGTQVPPVVWDFCAWLSDCDGDVGYFSLLGDRLDDFYVEDGTRAATSFVSFIRCKDGSRVGWWRPDGEQLADAPIVVLGGEGDLAAIAASAEAFLVKLASGRTGVDDLMPDEGAGGCEELGEWLRDRGLDGDDGDDGDLARATESLHRWFDRWAAARAELAARDPERRAVAALLQRVIGLPARDPPWRRTFADLVVTGSQCQLFGNYVGSDPRAVPPELESALRAFRARDARELPEAGLWFRASLVLDADGRLTIQRSYLDRPKHLALDPQGLRADAEQMPRSPYWTPAWLEDARASEEK